VIENVEIHNFRALRNVKVSLTRLTVLIGPNNSGKTSFLRALDFLGNSKLSKVKAAQPFKFGLADFWRRDVSNEISMHIGGRVLKKLTKDASQYTTELDGFDFSPVAFFRLPFDVRMTSVGFTDTEDATKLELGTGGENVASMVDYMLRRARSRFDAMEAEARQLIPGLQSLSISTPTPDKRRLDLVMEDGWEMSADSASSGVRLLLFFLTLAHRPDPPRTILIEEPENGIHPTRLESVMKMLIRLAETPNGPQVILSTHSPYLLDCLSIERHKVLVFSRDPEGGCTAHEVDAQKLKPFLTEFMLGEVWMNQGEDELVQEPHE